MKRSTKAAVAGGVAVLLLAGGLGTFARWYDTAEVGQTTVNTGQLDLNVQEGEWKINTPNSTEATEPFNPESDEIVPGDVVTYSATATPTLVGKNLVATLEVNLDSSGIEQWVTTTGEPGKIQMTLEATGQNGAVLDNLTEANNGEQIGVELQLVFPEYQDSTEASTDGSETPDASWWGSALQGQELALQNINIALTQNNR